MSLGFTADAANAEIDLTVTHLRHLFNVHAWTRGRLPICRSGQAVSLMMPYNCVAWPVWDSACLVAAGNPVRVRLSSRSGNISEILHSIFQEALGDPVTICDVSGAQFTEMAFSSDSTPLLIAYGSERTGDQLFERSRAVPGTKVVFEGPGKDPVIVMDGSDLDSTAALIARSKLEYSGQQCISPELLLVDRRLHDPLVERLVSHFDKVVIGDPSEPATELGPMGSSRVPRLIQEQLHDATSRGASIACGGKIDGLWVEPTVVTGVTTDMSIFQEESFGPVLAVAGYDDDEHARALAGSTRFGLHCTVIGAGAATLAATLAGSSYATEVPAMTFGKFGTTSVDGPLSFDVADEIKPFGGYGKSGWVRESGRILQGPKLFAREATRLALSDGSP